MFAVSSKSGLAEALLFRFTDVQFIECTAQNEGGALLLQKSIASAIMHIDIRRCTFYKCTANLGGAMLWRGADLLVRDSIFDSCRAEAGGAVNFNNRMASDARFIGTNFTHCSSENGISATGVSTGEVGGGTFAISGATRLRLNDCLIADSITYNGAGGAMAEAQGVRSIAAGAVTYSLMEKGLRARRSTRRVVRVRVTTEQMEPEE